METNSNTSTRKAMQYLQIKLLARSLHHKQRPCRHLEDPSQPSLASRHNLITNCLFALTTLLTLLSTCLLLTLMINLKRGSCRTTCIFSQHFQLEDLFKRNILAHDHFNCFAFKRKATGSQLGGGIWYQMIGDTGQDGRCESSTRSRLSFAQVAENALGMLSPQFAPSLISTPTSTSMSIAPPTLSTLFQHPPSLPFQRPLT